MLHFASLLELQWVVDPHHEEDKIRCGSKKNGRRWGKVHFSQSRQQRSRRHIIVFIQLGSLISDSLINNRQQESERELTPKPRCLYRSWGSLQCSHWPLVRTLSRDSYILVAKVRFRDQWLAAGALPTTID